MRSYSVNTLNTSIPKHLTKILLFKRQPHKMVKHTLHTNCLSVFDHCVGSALKGLLLKYIVVSWFYFNSILVLFQLRLVMQRLSHSPSIPIQVKFIGEVLRNMSNIYDEAFLKIVIKHLLWSSFEKTVNNFWLLIFPKILLQRCSVEISLDHCQQHMGICSCCKTVKGNLIYSNIVVCKLHSENKRLQLPEDLHYFIKFYNNATEPVLALRENCLNTELILTRINSVFQHFSRSGLLRDSI